MRWTEITIHTTEEAIEMVSNFFHEAGAGGVSIEESGTLNKKRDTSLGQWYELPLNDIPEGEAVIKGYFADPENPAALADSLKRSVEELTRFGIEIGQAAVTMKEVREEDWAHAWKQYYKPVRVSERITVKPTWEEVGPDAGDIIIELDPGMAFGTGTHATTILCLQSLERVIAGGEDVIDVGTGSGILAVAAVRLGARRVLALDLDPVAVSSAEDNVRINGLQAQIAVRESDLLQVLKSADGGGQKSGGGPENNVGPENSGGPENNVGPENSVGPENNVGPESLFPDGRPFRARVVVANILAEVVLMLTEDVYEALEPGGWFIASGVIDSKEKQVEEALKAARFEIAEKWSDQHWVVFMARKSQVKQSG